MKSMECTEGFGVDTPPGVQPGRPIQVDDFRRRVLLESLEATEARRGAVVEIDDHGVSSVVAVLGFSGADDVHRYLIHLQSTVLAALESSSHPVLGPSSDEGGHPCIVPIRSADRTVGLLVLDGVQCSESALGFATLLGWADQWKQLSLERDRFEEEARNLNARLEQRVQERTADLRTMLMEQESLARNARLRALGELATGVAHDFNNILSTILGQVHMLTQADEVPPRRLRLINQAAEDGVATARRIQEFASGNRGPDTEDVDVRTWIEDALAMTRTRWHHDAIRNGRELSVAVSIDDDVSMVRGRGCQLREVLVNLLINAVDAIDGHGQIRVTASLPTPGRLAVTVSDTGNGMDEDLRRRIFDPFFTTKGSGGTGLGLSVSHGIISEHGGTIEVQSTKGNGSSFRISLPVQENSTVLPEAGRALVIESDDQMRGVLVGMLELGGHRVDSTPNGKEGLAQFENAGHDVVLVDLSLQDMSAWKIVQHIRQVDQSCTLGLVTGWNTAMDADQLAAVGGVDLVVSRPLKFETVLDDLRRVRGARH